MCCHEDTITAKNGLPPVSTEGLDMFACLLDGEVIVARQYQDFYGPYNISSSLYGDSSLHIDARIDNSNIGFHLRARYLHGQEELNLFEINPFHKIWNTEVSGGRPLPSYRYFIIDDGMSSLIILRDDDVAFSGIFTFNAVGKDVGDTIHVTHGRFDIKNRD